MILMIDNYDSFVFNVEQYLKELTYDEVITVRNDVITIDDIKKMNPSKIIFSPGPKHPKDSGICLEILNNTDETSVSYYIYETVIGSIIRTYSLIFFYIVFIANARNLLDRIVRYLLNKPYPINNTLISKRKFYKTYNGGSQNKRSHRHK